MRSSLSMVVSNAEGSELHRIVLRAKARGRQQKPQNLRIGPGGPAGQKVQKQKHHDPAQQTIEKVERGGPEAQRKEEQFALGPEDRERPRKRPVNAVPASNFCHGFIPSAHVSWPEKATPGNSRRR